MSETRRLILTNSGDNSLFPMHLNLEKISSSEYRLDPTPESIALCDYFITNAAFDGIAAYDLFLKPGSLYIDGIEVQTLSAYGTPNTMILSTNFSWWPYHERYDDFFNMVFEVFLYDDTTFPKGTFRVVNDD